VVVESEGVLEHVIVQVFNWVDCGDEKMMFYFKGFDQMDDLFEELWWAAFERWKNFVYVVSCKKVWVFGFDLGGWW